MESPRSTAFKLENTIGSYIKLFFFFFLNPDCKISRCVHLSKECGSTSVIDYPTEQQKKVIYFFTSFWSWYMRGLLHLAFYYAINRDNNRDLLSPEE